MRFSKERDKLSPTSDDYAVGRHQQWECVAHEKAKEIIERDGVAWAWATRAAFIDQWIAANSFTERHRIRECDVCSELIAQATLAGANAFFLPVLVKNELQRIKGRLGPLNPSLRENSKQI